MAARVTRIAISPRRSWPLRSRAPSAVRPSSWRKRRRSAPCAPALKKDATGRSWRRKKRQRRSQLWRTRKSRHRSALRADQAHLVLQQGLTYWETSLPGKPFARGSVSILLGDEDAETGPKVGQHRLSG